MIRAFFTAFSTPGSALPYSSLLADTMRLWAAGTAHEGDVREGLSRMPRKTRARGSGGTRELFGSPCPDATDRGHACEHSLRQSNPTWQARRRIVLTTFGSLGDLHPYIAIALGLQAHEDTRPSSPPAAATGRRSRRWASASGPCGPTIRPRGRPRADAAHHGPAHRGANASSAN